MTSSVLQCCSAPLVITLLLLCLAVFIYSMPGYNCSVRDRMLYSSFKNNLVEMMESEFQIEIEKKVRRARFCVLSAKVLLFNTNVECIYSVNLDG